MDVESSILRPVQNPWGNQQAKGHGDDDVDRLVLRLWRLSKIRIHFVHSHNTQDKHTCHPVKVSMVCIGRASSLAAA